MTEQQAYDVLREYPDFELLRYPEHLVAEIEVGGPFELAGNQAFTRLARYIGGYNRSSRRIAMTAPVVQEQDSGSQRYIVGFVTCSSSTPEKNGRRMPSTTSGGMWARRQASAALTSRRCLSRPAGSVAHRAA